MQKINKSTNLLLLKIVVFIYMGSTCSYFVYSMIMKTGLWGYLIDVQFRLFGVAYDKLNIVLAILVIGAPASLILSRIKKIESSKADGIAKDSPTNARSKPMSIKSLLIIAVSPTLIAVPLYFILTRMSQKDQQREVYKVDLNRDSTLPSGDVKYVRLKGVVQMDYQFRLEEKSRVESLANKTTYAPLTGMGWTKGQPIRFFIDTTFTGYFNEQTGQFSSFPERGAVAVTLDGQLDRNGLPTFVTNEYQRNGLLIESPYFVLDRMSFVNGRVPSAASLQAYYLIPILGVLLSLAILVGGGIGLVIRKRLVN